MGGIDGRIVARRKILGDWCHRHDNILYRFLVRLVVREPWLNFAQRLTSTQLVIQ